METCWDEQAEADERWFRRNYPSKERVRPASVEEQVWMFQTTGGEVHDDIRITRDFNFQHKGHVYLVLEKFPA